QSQTVTDSGCCSSHKHDGTSQSASQSNEGSNSADQTATSRPIVVSGGNYAVLNKGDVNQNSGNTVDASSSNTANQQNNQSDALGQSQTVTGGGSCCHKHRGDVSQSADQSNSGSNDAWQNAYSAPCAKCGASGGNVEQNSGNTVYAPASSSATQTQTQSNAFGQTQSVQGGGCCPSADSGANWDRGCEHPCRSNCEPKNDRCEPSTCERG